jgi:EmrB/QacA subfamily drug resistance transporter
LILGVLSFGACGYTLLQSLVIPAVPALQRDLHTSASGATWVFTSFVVAASVITPIAGRLGDMFGKKRVLLIVLACVAAGSLMSAVVTTLPLMIVGRVIQGAGGAIFPLAFAIVRDEFPPARVAGAIALISGIFAIGAGFGILLAGPILQHLSYHWLFWIPFAVMCLAAAATFLTVPESPIRAPGEVFWLGALLLSGWLVALLVGVSKAPEWGWGDPRTLGLFILSAVLALAWVRAESRAVHPLVDMTMMRLRKVWTTNSATFLIGFAMYSTFVLIPQFATAPSSGFGLGVSVTGAGIYLLPSTIGVIICSPLAGRLGRIAGPKLPLIVGCLLVMVACVVLAAAEESWEIYLGSGIIGSGVGFAFASGANLIVEAVRPDQTGVASGMNTIVRTVGGSIGADLAATILAANTLANGHPAQRGYAVSYTLCAVMMVLGVVAAIAVPGRQRAGAPAPVAAVD